MIPHGRIRNALRRLWTWSPEWKAAKRRARLARGLYLCDECKRPVKTIEIDHVVPVGPTPGSRYGRDARWDDFMAKLFCSADGLRAICSQCHSRKTHAKEGAA